MATTNAHFYARNESRSYPLDDNASAVSAAGVALPPSVLADLSLRYPATLGRHPFLASLCVTPRLVSLTVAAAGDPDDPATFSPVASFTSARDEVEPYRHYPLAAQAGGCGGWVVFGAGVADPAPAAFSGRFASPAAGGLAPRAARPYRPLPVTSLGGLYAAAAMGGVVDLAAEEPLEVAAEVREVDGVARTVAVVRLVEPAAPAGTAASGQGGVPGVFQRFAGPCGGRPESGTCGEPEPVQFLNAVGPDCGGNLTIRFSGCAAITPVTGDAHGGCGVVVDCGVSLADACAPSRLPADDGRLPGDYDDACPPDSEDAADSVGAGSPPPAGGPGNYYSDVSESLHYRAGFLPYSENFDGFSAPPPAVPAGWRIVTGRFASDHDVSVPGRRDWSTDNVLSRSRRNLAIWEGPDVFTVGRRVVTSVRCFKAGPAQNGGLVLNWRPAPDFTGRYVFHCLQLDLVAQSLGVYYFNGTRLVPTSAVATVPGVRVDRWYKLEAVIAAAGGGNVTVTGRLYDGDHTLADEEGTTKLAEVTLTTANYYPDTGRFGLYADRSPTRWAFFRVTEA